MHPSDDPKTILPTEGSVIRWARLYDFGANFLFARWAAALRRKTVELAAILPGERVLDVGCGPGRLAILAADLSGLAGEVWGIDPSREMIAVARRNATRAAARVRFEVGVIEALPHADRYFDVVLSTLMLHHLPDPVKIQGLAEVHRVLRPGGRFVAVDFGIDPGRGHGHVSCLLGHRKGHGHATALGQMLHQAGFGAIDTGPIGLRGLDFVRGVA